MPPPARKPAKTVTSARPRRATSAAAKAPAPAWLRFSIPPALHERMLGVLEAVESAEDPTAHREALATTVIDLTRAGLDAYFTKPLELAKPGFIVEQTASLGMTGAAQVLSSVIGNIIGRMGPPQLQSVCGSIRQFMK